MSLKHETKSLGANSDTGFAHRSTPFASARARRQLHKSVGDLRDDDVTGVSGGRKTKSVEQLHRMLAKLVDIDIGEKLKATVFQTEAATDASRAAQRLPVATDPPAHAHCSGTRNKKRIDLIFKRHRVSKIS